MLFPQALLYSPQCTAVLELSLPKPQQVPGSLHAPAAALMVCISSNSPQLVTPLTAPWRGTATGFLTALSGLWEAVPGIFSWVSCVLQAAKEERGRRVRKKICIFFPRKGNSRYSGSWVSLAAAHLSSCSPHML